MSLREIPIAFECGSEELIGIVSLPESPRSVGVLILVGGPQVRTGSHRMFTLLARGLAKRRTASFRFDFRGMGDSGGAMRSFEDLGEDIAAAAAAFRQHAPAVSRFVLWGLCDGASAALLSLSGIPTVDGLVLVNPWVRTESSHNQAMVRHYYGRRLAELAFWKKLFGGKMNLFLTTREFAKRVVATVRRKPVHNAADHAYVDRMLREWRRFPGKRHIVLSGQDLTAREFEDLLHGDRRWFPAEAGGPVTVCRIESADHTFSDRRDFDALIETTCGFLQER